MPYLLGQPDSLAEFCIASYCTVLLCSALHYAILKDIPKTFVSTAGALRKKLPNWKLCILFCYCVVLSHIQVHYFVFNLLCYTVLQELLKDMCTTQYTE